jgi:hypothetical protein
MRMLTADVIFIPRTAVEVPDLDLPPDFEILLFRTRNWLQKEGYLFYYMINEKETGKAISPQFNILEPELTCQILKLKIIFDFFPR